MGSELKTERVRRVYRRMAPRYDSVCAWWERRLWPGGREWVCSRAKGDVLEHVRSPAFVVRAIQRLLDPITRLLESDHLVREPLEPLQAEGLGIEALERSGWGIIERAVARKP